MLDPRGLLDVIGVFHESREGESFAESQKKLANDFATRVDTVLGKWSGQLVTRRTGIYGATLAECNVQVHYERDDEGKVKQVLSLSLSLSSAVYLSWHKLFPKEPLIADHSNAQGLFDVPFSYGERMCRNTPINSTFS